MIKLKGLLTEGIGVAITSFDVGLIVTALWEYDKNNRAGLKKLKDRIDVVNTLMNQKDRILKALINYRTNEQGIYSATAIMRTIEKFEQLKSGRATFIDYTGPSH